MLSVLHVLSSLSLGGAERVALDLARFQRKQNIDAQILSFGHEDDFLVESVRFSKVPFHIDSDDTIRIRRYMRLLRLIRKFDVLHIHSRGAFKFIGPLFLLLRMSGVRIIYTRHGLLADKTLDLKILYRLLRPFISYVTFVTERGKEVFSLNHSWNPEKLLVVHNGIELPVNASEKAGSRPIRFGSVGRMERVKSQLSLLDAVKLLDEVPADEKAPLVLRFFGEGPLESELKAKSGEIKDTKIEFCGQQPDLEKLYREIDVLVVVSESEGLSMAILEAMSRGIPVIATDVGGNPTLVRNKETGILLKEQDSRSISDAIVWFLKNPAMIEIYGKNARSIVGAEFSLESTHEKYLESYKAR